MDESPDSCAIGPGERVSLSDVRLRECKLLPGTAIVLRYDTGSGGHRMKAAKSAPAIAEEVVGPPVPEPVAARVEVPTTATDELSRLVPGSGEVGGLSLVLAVIAVLGGGAAWRFYSQRSRERHELAMRELELRAAGGAGQGPECKAEGAAWRAEVQRIDERLAELEARQAGLQLPSVPEDLEERLARLEAPSKPARRSTTKGGR